MVPLTLHQGLGFRVWSVEFGVYGLGFKVRLLRLEHVPSKPSS